ncbi:hypothetical protein HP439_13920, partial [Sphingobacterium shayense]|uniref:hypothetical protein n=1 Tax=Sphingobacterium shayense TaxID=626343 RepID=UPI001C12EB2F
MKILNKAYIYIFATFLFGNTLIGCSEKLELTPTSIISPETVFATTNNAMAAVDGIHKLLYSQWYGNQANGG